MSLTKKVVKGISWNVIAQITRQIFNLGIIVILARLLSPRDFGLIGLAGTFAWFIPLFRDVGLNAAVIQEKKVNQLQLSTVFWVQLVLGIFCAVIIISVSPIAALFFREPQLKGLMMVLSIGVIFNNLGSVQESLLLKSLDFKRIAVRDIFSDVVGGLGGIIFAFLGYGVWSLVFRTLTTTFSRTILLWILSKWTPSFNVSITQIRPLINFGINKTIQRFIYIVKGRVDYFLIGKILGAEALGYYMIAFNLATRPITQISLIISSVTFPALSRLQDDLDRFRYAYLKIIKYISLVAFPALMGILIMAPEIVSVIYGAKWVPSIPIIQVLCLWAIMNVIAQPAGTVFFALGRAKTAAKWELVQAIIMISAVCIGLQWGIMGVAWSWVVSWIIIFPINQYIANRMIFLDFISFFKKIRLSFLITILMIAFVYLTKLLFMNLIVDLERMSLLIICVIFGVVLYLSMYLLMEERGELIKTKQYILSIIK